MGEILTITEDLIIVKGSLCPLSACDIKTLLPLGKIDYTAGLKLNDGRFLVSIRQNLYEVVK
jgi:hypothetical protein